MSVPDFKGLSRERISLPKILSTFCEHTLYLWLFLGNVLQTEDRVKENLFEDIHSNNTVSENNY